MKHIKLRIETDSLFDSHGWHADIGTGLRQRMGDDAARANNDIVGDTHTWQNNRAGTQQYARSNTRAAAHQGTWRDMRERADLCIVV